MPRLIENRGEKWSRADVFWGKQGPGNEGALLGIHNGTRANFRKQNGVYALYDAEGKLLYVGRTVQCSLFNRLWAHCKDRRFGHYTHFSWWGLRYVRMNGELSDPAQLRQMTVKMGSVYLT